LTRSESKPLAFALGDVEGWKPRLSCTLTALAAISGKTPRQIHQVLKASAASYGVSIPDSFLADYKVKHWQKAIELLGGHWTELPTGYAAAKFEDRPTISAWMAMPKVIKLRLLLSGSDRKEYHIFATFDN
jgi:hypothetical protein